MSDPKKSSGCFIFAVFAMFLGTFAFVVYRVTAMEVFPESWERSGTAEDPGFATMDSQLVTAQEKKQAVFQIRLEGTPVPLEGSWFVKKVGYDVVVFEGTAGSMTLRMESIVGFQIGPEEVKKIQATTPEPQVEK